MSGPGDRSDASRRLKQHNPASGKLPSSTVSRWMVLVGPNLPEAGVYETADRIDVCYSHTLNLREVCYPDASQR
jgi:hypothetical protein